MFDGNTSLVSSYAGYAKKSMSWLLLGLVLHASGLQIATNMWHHLQGGAPPSYKLYAHELVRYITNKNHSEIGLMFTN